MSLTITAYSTALFSTWYFVDELGLLFDAGDGVTVGLLQKSRKIKHIFISHADRDHLAGLMQLNQLNADMCPTIYYPKDCASFPYMKTFFKQFDPHSIGTKWVGIEAGDKIKISYSGDTPVEDTFRFHSSKVLIHEATFLAKGDVVESPIKNKHSTLEEVMEMVHKIDLEHLILGHFSVRYSPDTIKLAVETLRKKWNITIPITLVLPGEKVCLKI
jgi:ribonuclease BN (tRNA processing enzyme)